MARCFFNRDEDRQIQIAMRIMIGNTAEGIAEVIGTGITW